MNSKFSNIILGSIFILLGLGFFIDQIGLNLGFNITSLWPILVILFGIYVISKRNFIWGFIFSGIGIILLVAQLTNINIFSLLWPLIIIGVGLSILFKPQSHNWTNKSNVSMDKINTSVAFWGADWRIDSQNFKGGDLSCLFGGFKIDLREATISAEGATLNVSAVFGGGEIIVPESMRVESQGQGIAGAWENKFNSSSDTSKPVLKIKGSALFGGIEVKN